MSWSRLILLVFVGFTLHGAHGLTRDRRRGAYIGQLRMLQHNVSGKVWAVDEDKLYIEDFTYDGIGPDAFFWIGNGSQPSPKGHLIRYPLIPRDARPVQLPRIDGQNILLHLPPGIKVTDMDWFSVWCRRFTVDFGNVGIPSDIDPPRKRVLPEFQRLAHGLRSGNITILDARTFYIPNLHYDGQGPDAYFWVGKGTKPDPKGHKIPNEVGSLDVLRAYEGEDIELQLPENLTVYDIDYLGVWCVTFKHNFGHVQIPRPEELWVPPALGQTRIKLELDEAYEEDEKDQYLPVGPSEAEYPDAPRRPPSPPPTTRIEAEITDNDLADHAGSQTDSDSGSDPQAVFNTGSGPDSNNMGGASSFLTPTSHLTLILPVLLFLISLASGSSPAAGSLL